MKYLKAKISVPVASQLLLQQALISLVFSFSFSRLFGAVAKDVYTLRLSWEGSGFGSISFFSNVTNLHRMGETTLQGKRFVSQSIVTNSSM